MYTAHNFDVFINTVVLDILEGGIFPPVTREFSYITLL